MQTVREVVYELPLVHGGRGIPSKAAEHANIAINSNLIRSLYWQVAAHVITQMHEQLREH